jgi:hypothetical protein
MANDDFDGSVKKGRAASAKDVAEVHPEPKGHNGELQQQLGRVTADRLKRMNKEHAERDPDGKRQRWT